MPPEESAELEFKASFDPKGEWPELIKDIVAMANAGGGQIWIGVNDDGTPSEPDIAPLLAVDLADVINKIRSFTDINFSNIKIAARELEGKAIASIEIAAAQTPLIFSKSGNYALPSGKQKHAFNQGSFYVRHGSKSEPATSDDLRTIIERHVSQERSRLLVNLRQVIEAPAGSVVRLITPQDATRSDEGAIPVRLVSDDKAQVVAKLVDPNDTHPYRQKEMVDMVNLRLGDTKCFTTHDNLGVRRLYDIEQRKDYFYSPNFGSPLYSEAYVEYLVKTILANPNFLEVVRKRFSELRKKRIAEKRRNRDDDDIWLKL